ncbi:MAG TPA: SOS response-associated peptidase [Azospirillum sp.]|nr:SOS response-associated peptidase [Azospirillum sp.]
MCGRYYISTDADQLARKFGVTGPLPNVEARYNAAPTQSLPVIRRNPETGERVLSLLRWGLIPVWAKDASIGNRMINARRETVATTAAYRTAFQKRRCLIPADGFFEWKKVAGGKQPYAITTDAPPFVFAGLWEGWKDPATEQRVHTYTIITGPANAATAEVHDRMPVILPEEHWGAWLGEVDGADLGAMLQPYPAERTRFWPVSKSVGNVRNDSADLLTPNPA